MGKISKIDVKEHLGAIYMLWLLCGQRRVIRMLGIVGFLYFVFG